MKELRKLRMMYRAIVMQISGYNQDKLGVARVCAEGWRGEIYRTTMRGRVGLKDLLQRITEIGEIYVHDIVCACVFC